MYREQWTKKLIRMITDVESLRTPAQVRELYVFGSYARGAQECKDLDLVIVHEEPPVKLMEKLKKKAKAKGRSFLDRLAGHETRFKAMMGNVIGRFKTSHEWALQNQPGYRCLQETILRSFSVTERG